MPTVQKRGAAIIAARGASSAASAGAACIDHIRDWHAVSWRELAGFVYVDVSVMRLRALLFSICGARSET